MRHEHIFVWHLAWLFLFFVFFFFFFSLLLHPPCAYGVTENGYSRGCAGMRCENGSRCIKRRFWCKSPPCPGMLYCSRSRREALKGPPTCDTVLCNRGDTCVVKVRGCRWDTPCKQQIARCITEREYYEGAASCAGFECPSGKRCILRESHCLNPPCKLIRSCAEALDAQAWLDECRSLNCTSEYECFLRKPDNNCLDAQCTHTADCTFTTEDELISKYCRGWTCPRAQKCAVRIAGTCKGFNCTIERLCRASSKPSATYMNDEIPEQYPTRGILTQTENEMIPEEVDDQRMNTQTSYPITEEKPVLVATQTPSTHHTTPNHHEKTEVPLTQLQQRVTTTKSNLIAGSPRNGLFSTTSYPRFQTSQDKLSTGDNNVIFEITPDQPDSPPSWRSAFSTTTLSADRKTEPTVSRDTNKLDVSKKLYIASDDALPLPVVLEGINFAGQGYPIWIRKEPPYPSAEAKNEDGAGWGYHAPHQLYRSLLPPYEPVFLVEDTRGRGQFFPFLTYAFDYPAGGAAFVSLPEITVGGIMEDSEVDDTPTIVDDAIGDHANSPTTVKIENFTTHHFDDSLSDYANSLTTEKTSTLPSNIRDKQQDNYDNYDWYAIHDHMEPGEPEQQESRVNVNEYLTDDHVGMIMEE